MWSPPKAYSCTDLASMIFEWEVIDEVYFAFNPQLPSAALPVKLCDLLNDMITHEAISPEYDMRSAEQLYTVPKEGNDDSIALMDELHDLKIAEKAKDLPSCTQWRLTSHGMRVLDPRLRCSNQKPLFCSGSGPLGEWTVYELLHYLLDSGWDLYIVPRNARRSQLVPYTRGSENKLIHKRAGDERLMSKPYLSALVAATRGDIDKEVQHLQPSSYYSKLLDPNFGSTSLRRRKHLLVPLGDAPPRPLSLIMIC